MLDEDDRPGNAKSDLTFERTMTPSKLHGKRRHSETAPMDGVDMSPKETSSLMLRNTYDTRSMRPKETFPRPNGSQGPLLRKWAHGPPLRYRLVNGRAEVEVPWRPTWEPANEFPEDQVAGVKASWEREREARSRLPPTKRGSKRRRR